MSESELYWTLTREVIEPLKQNPPEVLFHYTSQEGLKGIVQSKTLWATNIHYLNDSSEYTFALDLARQLLMEREKSEKSTAVKQLFERLLGKLERIRTANDYVISLTEEPDLLSQWRAYAPVRGYSIGFPTESIQEKLVTPDFIFCRCVYNPESQRELMAHILDGYVTYFRRVVQDDSPSVESEVVGKTLGMFATITRVAPLIKHESFSEEKEWRIIKTTVNIDAPIRKSDPVLFRTSNAGLIPYNELRLAAKDEQLKIRRLILGPTPEPDRALRAAEDFLISSGIRNVKPEKSRTPYRGW